MIKNKTLPNYGYALGTGMGLAFIRRNYKLILK